VINLPFSLEFCANECGKECGVSLADCPTYRVLTPVLQEACKANLHLLQYLHALPLDEIGIPEFYEKVNRSMKSMKNRNLIYPASDDVYIHILANTEDIRDHYIAVEPCMFFQNSGLLDVVEEHLVDFVEDLNTADDSERLATVLGILKKFVVVRNNGKKLAVTEGGIDEAGGNNGNGGESTEKDTGKSRTRGGSRNKQNGRVNISVSQVQYDSLCYQIKRKLEGMSVLDPMMQDTNIEDISCSGLGNVFIEHKIFGGMRTGLHFGTHKELDKFVIELADLIKQPVTFRNPTVDAVLPDGSRINIVYGTDVSKRGSNFTIRKFSPTPISIIELIQFGTLDNDMAGYLSLILQESMNVFIAGETASGKTTLMNALTTFLSPESKIVSIEDTPELQVPHPNWIRGVTRGSARSSGASEVSMFDLLKAALRQRPNIIIIGEIRGEEGAIAFQAMQTGHACMSTFHASSVPKLIQRLSGRPINIPKAYVDNLNVVVIVQQVRLANGQTARRITGIYEIVSYDSIGDSFSFIEVFRWNQLEDEFDFRGANNSYLLEEKIAGKRGIPYEKRAQIYSQVKQRSEVLRRIQKQKITNFNEVYTLLSKAYREGYFR